MARPINSASLFDADITKSVKHPAKEQVVSKQPVREQTVKKLDEKIDVKPRRHNLDTNVEMNGDTLDASDEYASEK